MQKERWLNLAMVWFFVVGLIFVAALPGRAEESAAGSEWQFGIEAYGWAPYISVSPAAGDDVSITLSDILDNLDFTFMSTLAAQKGKWTFLVDLIYLDMDIDDKGSMTVPLGPGLTIGYDLNVELKSWVVTPLVAYSIFESPKTSLDLVAGARYLWLETNLKVKTSGPLGSKKIKLSADGDVWDGVVGVRSKWNLSEKWFATAYLDAGTGESDFTWQAKASVGYRFEKFSTVFGYRHLQWYFDNDSELDDMYITGPYVGINFLF